MRQKVVMYLILFAIIVVGAPYFTGYLVETKFQDVIKMASELEPLDITILEYQRGWRKSYAKTRLTLNGEVAQTLLKLQSEEQGIQPSLSQARFNVILEHDIRHGPFVQLQDNNFRKWFFGLATIHSKLFLTEKAKEVLTAELGEPELFNLNGKISIEGDVNFNILGRPIKLKEAGGKEQVVWKGLQADWRISRDLKHFYGNVVLPGLNFYFDETHYYAQDVTFHTERRKTSEHVWLGKGTFTVNKMEVKSEKNTSWGILVLNLGGVLDAQQGVVDASTVLSLEQLKMHQQLFGPVHFSITLKNLEAQAVQFLFDFMRKMQRTETFSFQLTPKEVQALSAFLKARPEMHIENLNVHTASGDIRGVLQFAIGGKNANDLQQMQHVYQSIAAKAHFLIPKVLFRDLLFQYYFKHADVMNQNASELNQKALSEQALKAQVDDKVESVIQKYIESGTLIEKDYSFIVELELLQGILKVNGHPTEFSALLRGERL